MAKALLPDDLWVMIRKRKASAVLSLALIC